MGDSVVSSPSVGWIRAGTVVRDETAHKYIRADVDVLDFSDLTWLSQGPLLQIGAVCRNLTSLKLNNIEAVDDAESAELDGYTFLFSSATFRPT